MPEPIKPTALLQLEKGTLYDKQRERAELEPKPAKELKPRCPKRFSKEERREWKYYAAILRNYNLFTVANAPILELLATNTVHYKECTKVVAEKGIITLGPKKQPMYNPFFSAMNKIEEKIQRCLTDLGLSSTALARIGSLLLKNKKEKNEMESLLD